MSQVQRWDGHAREATDWNELRRDPELFFADGNTLIYLYSRGRSQRGPSFRIPYDFLLYSGCRPLVEQSLISILAPSPYDDPEDSPECDESYLYLHAPAHLSREQSFEYHVTTRNFFAWLMGVPIAGHDPVSALLALKDRMDIWRDEGIDNLKAICDYIREQGYGDISQLEARLSPAAMPTLYRDRSRRYDGVPTLNKPTKRSDSVAAARQSLKRRMKFSGTFHNRPHLADLVRPQKRDQLSTHDPLREGDLATIAYQDTLADAAPSTTTGQPKPKLTRSIGRNSNYTEILVPDYGNGLYHPLSPPPDTTTTTTIITLQTSSPISPTSPADAYVRRASQSSSSPTTEERSLPPPSPSSSSTTSSRHSDVPSLSSTYSTDLAESPLSASPNLPSCPFNNDHSSDGQNNNNLASAPNSDAVKIVHATDVEPDLIIDALIGELEAAGIGGKPTYDLMQGIGGRDGGARDVVVDLERVMRGGV